MRRRCSVGVRVLGGTQAPQVLGGGGARQSVDRSGGLKLAVAHEACRAVALAREPRKPLGFLSKAGVPKEKNGPKLPICLPPLGFPTEFLSTLFLFSQKKL